jgi:hypothetical protein
MTLRITAVARETATLNPMVTCVGGQIRRTLRGLEASRGVT